MTEDALPRDAAGRLMPDAPLRFADTPGVTHRPVKHDSGDKHVTGAAIYADDVPEPAGLLHVHIAGADFACGSLTADLAPVRAAPGVVCVLTGEDVPGENNVGPVKHDEIMLALVGGRAEVMVEGQALFAVVATSRRAARAAAKRAVISEPDFCVASTTRTPRAMPDMMRLRRGKWRAWGLVPKGISDSATPRSTMLL